MSTIDFHGVRLDDAAQDFITGTFEPEEMALADLLFVPGDRVVVAGAGMGWLAAWIARIVGAENVLAVEALKPLAQLINDNVAVDGVPVRCLWGVVTPLGESVPFGQDPAGWWLSRQDGTGEEVPGISLAALNSDGWDCVATDIEGAEVDVLTYDILAGYRKVLVELHDVRRDDTELVVQRLINLDMRFLQGYSRHPRERMRYQAWQRR